MVYFPDVMAQPGMPVWTNRYRGPGSGDEQASDITVDRNGNVLVTGGSHGAGSGLDYATIKYSNAGVPLWTNRYNGPANGDDSAIAVAVDISGNVLVTGNSLANPTNTDFVTIKYSSAGVPLWTNRYDGPNATNDYANAIAVDTNGNVYVTGWSIITGTNDTYATVCYSSAGAPLWTNLYTGPFAGTHVATSIALDTNADVFVTGKSQGSGNTIDFATVAYSNGGVPLWTNRYNGPANVGGQAVSVVADAGGDVFVGGSGTASNGFNDYVVLKYSGAGVPLWTNSYGGPGAGNNLAARIAVDGSGNVFVSGWSVGTNGLQEFATVGYSGSGLPLWTNRYSGSNAADHANDMTLDKKGNVFVTGWEKNQTSGNFEYATIGYSGAGSPLWTNNYVGPAGVEDLAYAVAVDNSGNVFVTGQSEGSSGLDYATIKYATSIPSPTLYLSILQPNNQLVLSWTNAGYGLQAATGMTSSFTNVPGATSPYTNSITGGLGFFRLITN